MIDMDDARTSAAPPKDHPATERSTELEEKQRELAEFRDAGVLTDAEVEEQMAMFRWHLS